MCAAPRAERAAAEERRAQVGVTLTVTGWALGLFVTVLIIWTPILTFGFRKPSLHLVLDTADACIALLVAYLVHARFRRHHRWQDSLLAQGLVLLAAAGFVSTFADELSPGVRTGTIDTWLPLGIRGLGAVWIAAAALADVRVMEGRVQRRWFWTIPAALVLMLSTVLWAARSHLPVAVDSGYVPASAQHPMLTGHHPTLVVLQILAAVCFFIASTTFAAQSLRRDDELLRWLGPACALGAFARLHYALYPSLYSDWLYTGDLLRTGCYLLLLLAAVREMRQYWTAQADAAVLEDRRRLARELHDGVIQELAYIRTEGHRLPRDTSAARRIVAACDRALDEARAAVQILGRPSDEPLGFVLRRAAGELAERYHIDLDVDVDDSVRADLEQRHALMRITREAVSNAVRHGQARRIRVQLSQEGAQRRLIITDDGTGFDVESTLAEDIGYGLVSIRDRARSLPGSIEFDSRYGKGSVVSVTW